MDENKTVTLNGKKLSETEFNQKKAELEKKKDVKLIEVEAGVYKTRIKG